MFLDIVRAGVRFFYHRGLLHRVWADSDRSGYYSARIIGEVKRLEEGCDILGGKEVTYFYAAPFYATYAD